MGEYYLFEYKEVSKGDWRSGFVYKNESTGWNEIFVEFTNEQRKYANEFQRRVEELELEQKNKIKEWVNNNEQ